MKTLIIMAIAETLAIHLYQEIAKSSFFVNSYYLIQSQSKPELIQIPPLNV